MSTYKENKKAYHKEYHKTWYQKNKKSVCDKQRQNKKDKRDWFVEYKSTLKCIQCGASHPAILDFHHRDRKQKKMLISKAVVSNLSQDRILAEIAKCDVLCANCHRIKHWNERGKHITYRAWMGSSPTSPMT